MRFYYLTVERTQGVYAAEPGGYDLVSCIGATWIGNGLAGTLELMRPAVRDGGVLLVGEPYWHSDPPPAAYEAFDFDSRATLPGLLETFTGAGLELVEMVLADGDSWDRYEAAQWWTVSDWLRAHPDDPEAPEFGRLLDESRRTHLAYGRDHLGWGVFVLRAPGEVLVS